MDGPRFQPFFSEPPTDQGNSARDSRPLLCHRCLCRWTTRNLEERLGAALLLTWRYNQISPSLCIFYTYVCVYTVYIIHTWSYMRTMWAESNWDPVSWRDCPIELSRAVPLQYFCDGFVEQNSLSKQTFWILLCLVAQGCAFHTWDLRWLTHSAPWPQD